MGVSKTLLSDWTTTTRPTNKSKLLLKKRIKADVSQWVWLFRSLLWKLNQSCLWPWLPEPSQHDRPPSWGPDDPGNGSPEVVGAPGAACGAKAPGVKGPFHKGCRLNSLSASICCGGDFLFFTPQAFSRSFELPSNFLFSQKRLGVERRKWLSPLLFQCPPPWGGCASEVYHLSFYALGELPSLFPSSVFPLQTVFSEWFYSNHLLFSAICVLHCSILRLCFSLLFCIFEWLWPWRQALTVYEMKV